VLTVQFTILGIPCLGLNGCLQFLHTKAFSFQVAMDTQEEMDHYWDAIVNMMGKGVPMPVLGVVMDGLFRSKWYHAP